MPAAPPVFAQAITDMVTHLVPMLANTLAAINGVPVQGLFQNAHSFQHYGDQIGYESAAPILTVPTTAVPSPAVGAEVSIGTADYLVLAHEPDGNGLSRLILEPA